MKLRVLPILMSFIGASAILFGGWFVYHSMALETPLAEKMTSLPGVRQADLDMDNDRITVTLRLDRDADLRRIMADIRESVGSKLDRRELIVKVDHPRSEMLEQWWSQVLFEVAEAMENREYTAVPAALERHLADLPGLEIHTSIDDEYVYVRLVHGADSKFVMLPRVPAQLKGVER
jgi:hypothetical protein